MFFKDFIKNPQTTIALTFLTHINSGIDGVINVGLWLMLFFWLVDVSMLEVSFNIIRNLETSENLELWFITNITWWNIIEVHSTSILMISAQTKYL